MRLDNEDTGILFHIVPETYGMDVPSACTIVIIAGNITDALKNYFKNTFIPCWGKYLDKVDRVMAQVDRITEDIAHMPVAAFIFRDKESDGVRYSSDNRYPSSKIKTVKYNWELRDQMSPALVFVPLTHDGVKGWIFNLVCPGNSMSVSHKDIKT